MPRIIVAWSTGETLEACTDHIERFDSLPNALDRYDDLMQQDDVLVCDVAVIIESTD